MTIYDFFSLLGGLGLFLFGMHQMGESLEKQAGSKLRSILEKLTSSRLKGVMLGAGITVLIQSSSATTVMVVGFVNSGVMMLRQAIGVVMGANIGTTITAWILSLTGLQSDHFLITLFKPTTFSPLLAFVGIILLFFFKRKRDTAGIMIGFAILMYGMELMSGSVRGLANVPEFVNMLLLFSNPLFGVLIGALVTALIQSSSGSVGILQALANTGSITFGSAIPIIMGQNIGTCITAILSAIGANKNAKRVSVVHLSFNIIGTGIFLSLFYALHAVLRFTFVSLPISAFYIAVIHSIFNVLTTLLLLPFLPQLEALSKRIVKDDQEVERFELLDERLLSTPSIAIEQSRKLTSEMALLAKDALLRSLVLIANYDDKEAAEIADLENRIDAYEDRIGTYLVKVSTRQLSEEDSKEVSKLLFIIGDFERISDHAVNVTEAAEEMYMKRLTFSAQAQQEIAIMSRAVAESLTLAVDAFTNNDLRIAERVEPLEEVVDLLRNEIKNNHVLRLQTGACTIELGFVLNDLLTSLERTSDHCSNIAASIIELEKSGSLDAHQYLKSIRSGQAGIAFDELYAFYLDRYRLPQVQIEEETEVAGQLKLTTDPK